MSAVSRTPSESEAGATSQEPLLCTLSVIVPLFNEEENVREVVAGIVPAVEPLATSFEIILVNDGSGDGTGAILAELAARDRRIKVINLRRNTGQTAAMMAGFDRASGEIIVPMDGDLQNDPADIRLLLPKLREGFDVVSGWRKDRKDNLFVRKVPSWLANRIISWVCGVKLHDYGCTLKAYRRDVLSGVRLYGELHRFVPIFASWQGARVTEIPVNHRARRFGVSKYGLNRTFKVILDLILVHFLTKYQAKPIYVFGTTGLLFLCVAFCAGVYAVYLKVFEATSFIQTPLPLLFALGFMSGMMCLLLGLISEVLVRTYFESQGRTHYVVSSTINLQLMCGIAGFFGPGTRADLAAMTDRLAHRGPDASGCLVDETHAVFLGHRRLSIIDVEGGAQPMSSDDGEAVIVFNGEIYNHRALRRELEALGWRFQTDHSDTEVLLRGYQAWGDGIVDRLDGMFAFALFDRVRRRLFLARDRFGEKPLFYHVTSRSLVFSSELPSLRRHPAVACAPLSNRALQKFFAYSFLPASLTPYDGVRKLLPGATLAYDLNTGSLGERRYWRFAIDVDAAPPGSVDEWAEEVAALLARAVKSRLESDVGVGVFLSGGIDSSAVAVLAGGERRTPPLSTFTVGFSEKSFDESDFADLMARHIGSVHYSEVCGSDFMRETAPEIFGRLGEPFGDPSILPTFMLSRHAARYVKVALGGDGSDELFAGYDPFKALTLARRYQALVPKPLHRALRLLAARMPASEANMSFDFKVNRAMRGLSFRPSLWNPVWLAAMSPEEIARVFDEPLSLEDLYSEAIELWDGCQSKSVVDRTLEYYTNLYLPDDILVKTDRAGMLNGLEIRAPFLANELVEFVRRLPHDVKYRDGTTKWILKRALKRLLPDEIVRRRKKGLGIPVAKWMREMDPFDSRPIAGLRDAPFRLWDDRQRSRRSDHRGALWCRYVLEHVGV